MKRRKYLSDSLQNAPERDPFDATFSLISANLSFDVGQNLVIQGNVTILIIILSDK